MSKYISVALVGLAVALSGQAQADVVLNSTRFIYPAGQASISISARNGGERPALVRLWVDRGNLESRPEDDDAPFLVMPPMYLAAVGQNQQVRVLFTGTELPADRESLFWINLLDVPPLEGTEKDAEQVAVRSRLKLFYRPAGLPGSAETAIEQLDWRLLRTGNGYVLRASNASAYHLSFNEVHLQDAGRHYAAGAGTVAPFASQDFPVADLASPPRQPRALVLWITDHGALVRHEQELEPNP
ncbi:molecular chaperone [Metapseudomonas resinovorans]|uniref:Putative type 1 pili assembly chaperone n=1 Tax=Metapseudomonas resinovorans NBRC 106553 TaxID=1245471 RepID=S6ALD4_METRE|nr:molecular chaperone [Pseudomonas resinovorans]BAN46158.1 putative type 1 pili assembly chaperone [Pseudomonas resinovorans NBRC 106553]